MKILDLSELTAKCLDDGWDMDIRSVPAGIRNLRDYFDEISGNIPTEDYIGYDIENDVPSYPEAYTTVQRNYIHSLCYQIKNVYQLFIDPNNTIIARSGFQVANSR